MHRLKIFISCLFLTAFSLQAGEYSPTSVEFAMPNLRLTAENVQNASIPLSASGSASTAETSAFDWRLHSRDAAEIEFLPQGETTYTSPCLHVKSDGTSPENYVEIQSTHKIPAHAVGKVMLFKGWVRFKEGYGRLNATLFKDGKPVSIRLRTSENMMSIESQTWNQCYVKIPCTGDFDEVTVRYQAWPIRERMLQRSYEEEIPDELRAHLTNRVDFCVSEVTLEVGEPLSIDSFPKVEGWFKERVEEKMARELTALPAAKETEGWYLTWRFLKKDTPETAFDLFRREIKADGSAGEWTRLNAEPLTQTTDFQDFTASKTGKYEWKLREPDGTESLARIADFEHGISIKLRDPEAKVSRMAIADLDGDGKYDYVILTNKAGWVDPYFYYWRKAEADLQIEAYSSEGKFLWGRGLGPGIEPGIWYSPFIAADLDGDGRAEIAIKTADCGEKAKALRNFSGRVDSGAEYLSIWDGLTGEEITKVNWPSRNGLAYNYYCRSMLSVAYLDGKTPILLALRGTYSLQKMLGWQFRDGKLEQKLLWTNAFDDSSIWGKGAHTLHSIDVDGDQRDEIAVGTFMLDDNGAVLWAKGLPHPDHLYFGEILPSNPGLEVYWGLEGKAEGGGMGVLDAKTGEFLWKHEETTYHIHGQGMCADIDPNHPGCECFGGEEKNDYSHDRFLWTAEGKLLQRSLPFKLMAEKDPNLKETDLSWKNIARWPLGFSTLYWDADPQREMVLGREGHVYSFAKDLKYEPYFRFNAGSAVKTCDVLGDWREELFVTAPGELRIYMTKIPAKHRRPCLMQDRNYRASILESSMGYAQSPMLSTEP